MKFNCHLKKYFSIFIISLLLFNSSGYVILYISSLHFVKKHIIKAIDRNEYDKEILLLTLSKKDIDDGKIDFQWIHSREFRHNGKMYDIKKNISDEDSIRVYCYYDEKENLLEQLFHQFAKSENEKSKQKNNTLNLLSFIGLFCYSDNPSIPKLVGTHILYNLNIFYDQFRTEVPTPPPQNLLV